MKVFLNRFAVTLLCELSNDTERDLSCASGAAHKSLRIEDCKRLNSNQSKTAYDFRSLGGWQALNENFILRAVSIYRLNFFLKFTVFFICLPFFLFAENSEFVQLAKEIEVRSNRLENEFFEERKRMDELLEHVDNLEFKIRSLVRDSADLRRELSLVPKYHERGETGNAQIKLIVNEWNDQSNEFCGAIQQSITDMDFATKYEELLQTYMAKRKAALLIQSGVHKSKHLLIKLKKSVNDYIKIIDVYQGWENQWNLETQQVWQKQEEISKEMEILQNRLRRLQYLIESLEDDEEILRVFKSAEAAYQKSVNDETQLRDQLTKYQVSSDLLKKQLIELATPFERVFLPQIEQASTMLETKSSEIEQNLEEMISGLSALIVCYQPLLNRKSTKNEIKEETNELAKNYSYYVVCHLYIPQINKDSQAPLIKTSGHFVLKIENEAISVYSEHFFNLKKKLYVPITVQGKDLQFGEVRRYEGGLLLEVDNVYSDIMVLRGVVNAFSDMMEADPFSYLIFERADGVFSGSSHYGNVQLSWKGGPISEGWTPAAKEKSYLFFKQMLKE